MSKLKIFFLTVIILFIASIPVFLTPKKICDKKTVIKFTSWGSESEIKILKPILSDFEKENPDLKVEFIHIPENYFQKIHLLFASNLAPDVIFINNLYLPIYANAGVLEEINKSELQDNGNEFFKKSLDALSYKGKLYAVPRDVSNLVIYYNKDIFDKYHVPYPNKNWTYNDFLKTAQKLTKDTDGDGTTDLWGISFEDNLLFYLPYLMSEGGGVLSDDLKTNIIDTKASQKGLNFYADLRNKYHVAPRASESASATMAQLFLQKRLAMQLSGRWLVPKFRSDAKFNWDIVNFPSGDKGSIVPMDASGWAISKSSKNKSADLRLIKFLASKTSIEKFSQGGLIVPARIDVAKGKFLQDKNLPPKSANVFIDIIKTSKKTPVTTNYKEVQDNLKERTDMLFNANN